MKLVPWQIKRKLITKVEEETNPAYGLSPEKRSIKDHIKYGIINLDKPSGPTSHDVVAWVKKILNINHAGHGGTLDPKVTGVLPVTLEESTKISRVLLLSGKEYVCAMRLHSRISGELVKSVMNEFVGEIVQRPPIRSSVSRRHRKRTIYYLDDFEFKGKNVLFRVSCQSGTYIRKLCFDVGEALGSGAHMEELRRTRAGPFNENENFFDLYDLYEAYHLWVKEEDESLLRKFIQPMEKALEHVPHIYLLDSAVDSVCHGANLAVPGIVKLESDIKKEDLISLFTLKGELVALARALMSTEEMLEYKHGIAAKTLRVIMASGTYPRMWRKKK